MKVNVVSFKEVSESPTLCLSPLRYFGECHRCKVFLDRVAGKRRLARTRKGDLPVERAVDGAISELRCKPRVKDEIVELLRRKERLLAELHEINERLEEAAKLA